MAHEIIVNTTGRETRIAVIEGGRLTELHVDRGDNRGHVGNLYLGKVVRVLPGMQAAFVDIGLERAAFLYAGDIFSDFLDNPDHEVDDPDDVEEPSGEDLPRATPRVGHPPIQDLLREGQEILTQVAKDPIGTKGARLTTHITLPGRYMVFMPTVDHVGISRRIERDKERRKLREFVEKNRPKGAGFIVRTVCEGKPTSALKLDMDYLTGTWDKIQKASRESKAPALLHADYGLVLRVVRDSFNDDVDRMVLDSKDVFERVQRFMGDFMPHLRDRVQLYKGADPIFDTFGIESEITRSMGRKVWLKSGGYLIIDQTEALTAIDVNSGKFVGSSSLEETTLAINLEAAQEIVHQLRLRNIGGIIVLDMIDMEKATNRERLYRALEDELKNDRARTNALKISDLGLIEMTRKRVQEDLTRYLSEPCAHCEGRGHTRSRATVVYDVLRELQRVSTRASGRERMFVNCHPLVADMLYSEEFAALEELERRLNKSIVVRALGHYNLEKYEVYAG